MSAPVLRSSALTVAAITFDDRAAPRIGRLGQVLLEFLLISISSFALTTALLPLFGLRTTLATVALVTASCSIFVVVVVDLLRGHSPSQDLDAEGSRDELDKTLVRRYNDCCAYYHG
uniref:Uncharacterized protein n=1 Tax=Mycena chlorophos TaxID=658473 RepID=A0ABQ0MAF5_MYCCL|nr:predicted protein [Mycena chlorophos]